MSSASNTEKWTILSPIANPRAAAVAPAGNAPPTLGRPIRRVRVGLEVDYAWTCYQTVIDEWEHLLRAEGAEPSTLWVERSRREPARDPTDVKAEVEEWAKLVECGVVGLGN
jgi:hypothetical protein